MAHITRAIAERKGEGPALVDETGRTSWAEFDARVNRVVNGMRSRGLRQGDTVALLCGNRREFFEVMVAVMHAGLVVVPVNWHWVAEELAYVIDDSEATALVVDGRFAAVAADACRHARTSTCVNRFLTDGSPPEGFEDYEKFLAEASSEEPDEQISGGVMFYTSGTTGFPKGVRSAATQVGLEPAVVELLAQGVSTMLRVPEDGITLLDGPAYHSAQWACSVLPLLGAASTVVMRHRFDPAETLRVIDE